MRYEFDSRIPHIDKCNICSILYICLGVLAMTTITKTVLVASFCGDIMCRSCSGQGGYSDINNIDWIECEACYGEGYFVEKEVSVETQTPGESSILALTDDEEEDIFL